MTEIPFLSATATLDLYRRGELSPVEVVDALIDHAERNEPVLNAIADRRFDEARAEARAAEARWMGRDGGPRPLEGLAVAAKEEHPMVGRSWTQGSLTLRDHIAEVDHPIIERIQAAGGIIHLRTTTPEFCCAGFCHSRLWGTTRNPWNHAYSPGGSSGGSGAALAAGYAPLATGSDIGGSIRIPASFSGVVGFKPPFGRVPAMPPYNLDQYCHDDPMARTVADTALLQNVIAGHHPLDQASLRDAPTLPLTAAPVTGQRVALCVRLGDWPLDPAVEANTRAVGAALAATGVLVEEVELPWRMENIWEVARAHFATIMGAGITHEALTHGDELSDYTLAFAATFTGASMGFYDGMQAEGRLWAPLGTLFEQFNALVCPTIAVDGLLAGEPYLDRPIPIGESSVDQNIKAMMTLPFNLFSRCPVLSVPSGRSAIGVPTGVQIVGCTYDDAGAFALAAAVEAAGYGFGGDPGWRPSGLR